MSNRLKYSFYMGVLRICTDIAVEFLRICQNILDLIPTLGGTSVMETFNIKEAGKELERTLKEELGPGNLVRLTIDVQIPEFLHGDKKGFYNSIIQICAYMNRDIVDLNIDIELLKLGQFVSEVKLNVTIRGSHADKEAISAFVDFRQDRISSLLKVLPYPTKFSYGDLWLDFSFLMTFQYSGETEGATDFFVNKKILLAEENELSALTFIALMEEWGCHVTKVSGGLLAIEEVKHAHYDIVLINIHSPEMNGIEAIRKIRNFDQHVPIIGLTSPWTKDHTLKAYAAGINDILAKPVSSGELQKILRKFI
jgi:CheY-like chemotaxis protein